MPGWVSTGVAERSYPMSGWGAGGREELHISEVRRGRQKEQPHVQGVHRCRKAERSYSMFKLRRAAMRRYTSSKVRSSSCALLEQP